MNFVALATMTSGGFADNAEAGRVMALVLIVIGAGVMLLEYRLSKKAKKVNGGVEQSGSSSGS
jgi:hypothetical protein